MIHRNLQKIISYFPFLVWGLLLSHCTPESDQGRLDAFSADQLIEWNRKLTTVIVADIFTPPVASRIYCYPNIAAYEALCHMDSTYQSLAGRLNALEEGPVPDAAEAYYFPISGVIAFTTVAKELVYNRERIEEMESVYLLEIQKLGIQKGLYNRSVDFGRLTGAHILEWAAKDGYNERTALNRFTINKDPGRWQPTPPDYMEAIEPHWNTLRPFVLQSADQFNPGSPTPFDSLPGSPFYQETMDVYEAVNTLDEERLAIAKFWDCNPNISYTQGHVMYFQQQISPGGHWVHIAAQVLEEQHAGIMESANILAKVSIGIADAFISCWDEKYRSSLTRPETYINRYIDPDWEPILQTPAFPEHTSGHSVASSTAATLLTHLVGPNYAFIDSTEVPFGLPPRSFDSFIEAAEEAAISRMYGGIHYMPAIEQGVEQGKKIGEYVADRLILE